MPENGMDPQFLAILMVTIWINEMSGMLGIDILIVTEHILLDDASKPIKLAINSGE